MNPDERGIVMIVEDDPNLLNLFSQWLTPLYDVLTAAGGEEALATITADVDVVLLDRRMPDLKGEAVLEAFQDQDLDCMIAMVTAVDPDVDIVDMEFDDYLIKPVTRDELLGTVDQLMQRASYHKLIQRYLELTGKIGLLMTNYPEEVLDENPDYRQLQEEHEQIETELRAMRDTLIQNGASENLFANL